MPKCTQKCQQKFFFGSTDCLLYCNDLNFWADRFFTVCYSNSIILYHAVVEPLSLNFRVFTVQLVGVQTFRNFRVQSKFFVYNKTNNLPENIIICIILLFILFLLPRFNRNDNGYTLKTRATITANYTLLRKI